MCLKVEGWLNRIQNRMRSSLRNYMSEAVVSYEEKPRDQWLFDYPAQVSLCGTQIWWTTEVIFFFFKSKQRWLQNTQFIVLSLCR